MSASVQTLPREDLVASVARDIGKSLSVDARYLLRLAVNLGLARAKEKDIKVDVCASWMNLVGAALLAPDPASRWLQRVKELFDTNDILPSRQAQLRAIKLAEEEKDSSSDPELRPSPPFFSNSIKLQLQAAASIGASTASNVTASPAPFPTEEMDVLHIVASVIIQPVGDHGTETAIGHGDKIQRSAILAHMARWMADQAFALNEAARDSLVSLLNNTEPILPTMGPQVAVASGTDLAATGSLWLSQFPEWSPPYTTNLPIEKWRACGPLGRMLLGFDDAITKVGYPPGWSAFLDLFKEAVGPSWSNSLPTEGGPLAGRGISLFARASALAAAVSRSPTGFSAVDLHYLVGAVFAVPDAALPPAFEPFPTFRPGLTPNARQSLRRRFLALITEIPHDNELLTAWVDIILGDRLVTARIPTDLGPAEDLLGFSRYAKAFASVIADYNVKPPLAIGLFGAWGSGKSSMIDMIGTALGDIEIRAQMDQELRFCRGIVCIAFNAWHYAETNLWASLFVCILQELSRHLRRDISLTSQDPRNRSLLDLDVAKKAQQDADADVSCAELAAAKAAQEAAEVDQALTAARQAEAALRAAQDKAVQAARENKSTQIHALELAGDAAALLLAFGRPTVGELAGKQGEELAEKLEEQRKDVSELAKSFGELSDPIRRLQLILGWDHRILVQLALAAAVAVPIACLATVAYLYHWPEAIAASGLAAIAVIGSAFAALGPLWARACQTIARAPVILNQLADAAERVRERANERRNAEDETIKAKSAAEVERVKATTVEALAKAESTAKKASDAGITVTAARAKADIARQGVAAAEAQVAEMAPERLLTRFASDRAASEEYGRELGLPTRIRRDIDTLRVYLADLSKATTAVRRADRVVLFVDDLDRCAPGVVVKVLEAVQMLLASDLFVIVVGVDVRWLTKSLARHHTGQFGNDGILNPEDFLEKIFQVPFWIPRMSQSGSRAIVRDALPAIKMTTNSAAQTGANDGQILGDQSQILTSGARNTGSQTGSLTPLPTLQPVELTSEEHAALLRWGGFSGDTPRRLKRFARSYLVLRASLLPAQLESFIANAEYDTVARLLAFNTAYPDRWSRFAALVRSGTTTDWKATDDLGRLGTQLFVETTTPVAPSPAVCLPWLDEVERFGFASENRTSVRE